MPQTPGPAQQMETGAYYINPNVIATDMSTGAHSTICDPMQQTHPHPATDSTATGEESSDEIQRYMQIRGCAKRHTVGCTDDLSVTHHPGDNCCVYEQNVIPGAHMGTNITQQSVVTGVAGNNAGGGIRTRRTGLLTVTERPPVISPELIREVESRMNRNYMPPALKMQQSTNVILSQSPPSGTFGAHSHSGSSNILQAQSLTTSSVPLASSCAANNRRIYGRACKLPTVQEVGRYSPVRRASEGSKAQFQGPLQECQYLQKGIAQRNFLVAPSPPLLENSISLPGSPIHGKPAMHMMFRRNQDIEIPQEAIKTLLPVLDRLTKEQRISIEMAKKIMTTGTVPLDLASYLGLAAHSQNTVSGGNLDILHTQPQQMQSCGVLPLTLSNNANTVNTISNTMGGYSKQMLGQTLYQQQKHSGAGVGTGLVCQFSNINLTTSGSPTLSHFNVSNNSSGCQSPVYNSFSGSSSPNTYMTNNNTYMPCGGSGGSSSPLHQITKGISGLTTGGGGSITRGTSAACEYAYSSAAQPLDLSMDVCSTDILTENNTNLYNQAPNAQNWFLPPASYYDLKPLNLSPAQPVRVVTTPPASPNLCIIQEEIANGQMCHSISTGTPYAGCTGGVMSDESVSACQPAHPQICLTDVQGSEITLVSSENSHDSDCESIEPHTPLVSLQGLIITEPSTDMPSITRGIGRKASLENENISALRQEAERNNSTSANTSSANTDGNRRGSDKSLGFSDDSLSNDSNNLSPCQEPSASSGFKSDSHSEIGDQTEGHLTPDSMCDSRRMSEEMCYEVPLPHECSNLDSTRILEIVKQTIDSTMPPKGFILHKGSISNEDCINASTYVEGRHNSVTNSIMSDSSVSSSSMDTGPTTTNLNLEFSGGLQIELQVCEGRSRDNQGAGKGIKLRRISGDQFEYGKLCQQLISTLTMQQVAG
ncbi:uncharacterized protein LOC119679130 [Teleopsis dalmanni]|uniref:uncharacterized protein LOC119679130 n=1 Tax=Teleopsis dalmanni TaxID=139649 RepID=UPI0018CE3E1C|nr:uncharacterized protein LOC119679130 [Teleopsis dalmanni]